MLQSPMNEKLEEARYFRTEMDQNANNSILFKFLLSAFLTAARSVMLYVHAECSKEGGRRWYDKKMADHMLRFFRSLRNVNIHEGPVEPQLIIELTIIDQVSIEESSSIKMNDEYRYIVYDKLQTQQSDSMPTTLKQTFKYLFTNWSGPEDVQELCDKYIIALQRIVDEWHEAMQMGHFKKNSINDQRGDMSVTL